MVLHLWNQRQFFPIFSNIWMACWRESFSCDKSDWFLLLETELQVKHFLLIVKSCCELVVPTNREMLRFVVVLFIWIRFSFFYNLRFIKMMELSSAQADKGGAGGAPTAGASLHHPFVYPTDLRVLGYSVLPLPHHTSSSSSSSTASTSSFHLPRNLLFSEEVPKLFFIIF